MSVEVPYGIVEYGDGNSDEIVALVTGFGSKPGEFDRAGRSLVATGRDAVVYTYHPGVLLEGDAELLPELISAMSEDFEERAAGYPHRRYGGASLGGAIAANMQKRYDTPERGFYAATGGDAAEIIMKNRWFGAIVLAAHRVDIRRAFARHGYTHDDLQERWRDIQTPPTTPLTIALGGLDLIMRERKILPKIADWRAAGNDVRIIRKPWGGHNGMIKWFDANIASLLGPNPSDNSRAPEVRDAA